MLYAVLYGFFVVLVDFYGNYRCTDDLFSM